jgi:hypothetical protein
VVEAHGRQHCRHVLSADDAKADLALEFVLEARRDFQAADTRLYATTDALAAIPETAPHDAMLDFAIGLREAIRGRTEGRSVEEVRALTETFECFVMWEGGDETLPPEQGVHAGRIKIDPILRPEVVRTPLAGDAAVAMVPPPLEWIEAVGDSADAQVRR